MKKAEKTEKILDWINSLVKEKVNNEFYGKMTVTFSAGSVVQVTTETSYKPPIDNNGNGA